MFLRRRRNRKAGGKFRSQQGQVQGLEWVKVGVKSVLFGGP